MENTEQMNTETVGGEVKQPELNISDLQNLRAMVDTAARRGAFQASEMSAVGAVFDRLTAFLNAVLPKQDEAQPETAGE